MRAHSDRSHHMRTAMTGAGGAKAVSVPSSISFATGNANKLKEVHMLAVGCVTRA